MNLLDENTMRMRGRPEWGAERRGAGAGRAWAPARGFSIIELVVVITLATLAIAIALPTLSRPSQSPQNLAADLQDFALNLQVARDLAISGGTHYRVRIDTASTYIMEAQAGSWLTQRSLTLRPTVTFDAGDVGKVVEFDTRGLCVSTACLSAPPVTFTLSDSARGWSKQVKVYARGMVDRP